MKIQVFDSIDEVFAVAVTRFVELAKQTIHFKLDTNHNYLLRKI